MIREMKNEHEQQVLEEKPEPEPHAATEPTRSGLQYVMPGCEKDKTKGPAQLSLF